jgi:hypothetical protein
MATEAARLEDKELTGRKKKNRLDSHRPSHGRRYAEFYSRSSTGDAGAGPVGQPKKN